MCGIVGWIGKPRTRECEHMLGALQHRGPDAQADWWSEDKKTWLGHTRLSIIDLADAANQPMHSACGRYVLVFNGEIYNYKILRSELEAKGCRFTTSSDTEVLLHCLLTFRTQEALHRLNGMFAFALWDKREKSLLMARDRMGEKPLYVAQQNGQFLFASELTALRRSTALQEDVDTDVLAYYFRYLCVPRGRSIFRDVQQIPPAHYAVWKQDKPLQITPYWDATLQAHSARDSSGDFAQASRELEQLLSDSVSMRMQSDVPYGAFLSGGIDSSLVAALMQSRSSQPIKTFTVGFEEQSHDESPYAEAIAKHLGTDHTTIPIKASEIAAKIPGILAQHDEPFADNSSIPTSLLAEHTRKHVTVALSGDGGDELFGGYPRYFWAQRIAKMQALLGVSGAQKLGGLLQKLPHARAARLGGYLATPRAQTYPKMVAAWEDVSHIMHDAPTQQFANDATQFDRLSFAEEMMLKDQLYYLPDDILTKMDRMSMAHSLEARVPLLDHRVVEFAWSQPLHFKCASKGDQGKLLLRSVLGRHVPNALFERPKMGFGLPLHDWLRGDLREWAESILNSQSMREVPHIRSSHVLRLWKDHLEGANHFQKLWTVLAYVSWLKKEQ